MTDNTRFKINSYLQLLKYVDDEALRNEIVETICVLLSSISNKQNCQKSADKTEACCNKMSELFKNADRIYALDAISILEGCGFSFSTIKRAKRILGIKSVRQVFQGQQICQGQWYWIKESGNE